MTAESENCFLCGEQCTSLCPHCKNVVWCSESHMEVHRSEDRCQPWRVDRQEGVGRIVVASRDIEPWELVMKDTALAVVMESDHTCVLCGDMLTEDKHVLCKCGLKKCENECVGQQHHLEECELIQKHHKTDDNKVNTAVLSRTLGFMRMFQLRTSDSAKWSWLLSFMSHLDERNKNKEFTNTVKEITTALQSLGVQDVNPEVVGHLNGIMATNALHMDPTGQAFFPHLCLASHSCLPSCEHWLVGTQARVRAKRKIKKGEELTIRYSYLSLHRVLLKEVIQDAWMFECSCERCKDKTEVRTFASAFKCSMCTEGSIQEVDNSSSDAFYQCNTCGQAMTKQEVIVKAGALRKLEMSNPSSADIPNIIAQITEQGGHALYHSVIQLKLQYIEQACSNLNDEPCSLVLEYCSDIHQYLQALNPGVSRQRGRVLFCCSKARMWMLQNGGVKEKMNVVREKQEILKMQIMAQKMISGYVK